VTRRLVVRPQAQAEILEARHWYDQQRAGLGEQFALEVDLTVSAVLERPLSFPVVHGATRRAIVRRFPYGVFFRILSDEIVILGIVHGHREPSLWRERR
jgi:plasmid stabilization system protein ParE